MFDLLRSWIKPIIYLTLLFFVALIVLEWGAQFSSGDRYSLNTAVAGVVNGEEIPRDRYYSVYNNLTGQQFPDPANPPTAAQAQRLKSQAWTSIVNDMAVLQEIDKQGVEISNEDIYYYLRYNPPQFLQSLPQFQTDGEFDYQKYLQIMADPVNSPLWAQVEAIITPQVKIGKMQEVVTAAARLTRDEIRRSYLYNTELGRFNIAFLDIRTWDSAAPTPSEQSLNDYYQRNLYRFQNEERRNVRVALFSKDVSEADWARVREEAQEYADMAHAGGDFGALAALYSSGPSASDSGALGYLATKNLDSAYVAGALALEIGEISGPVRSSFGWHVIKLLGVKDTSGAELKSKGETGAIAEINTAHILIQVEASEQTLDDAEAAARRFKNSAENAGFVEAAANMNVEIKNPTPFRKQDAILYVGVDYFANEWAFTGKMGDISGVYENASNFYVMLITEISEAGPIAFSDIRASIETLVKNEALKDLAVDSARVIHQELAEGRDFETTCKEHNAVFLTTSMISRGQPLPPPIGQEPKGSGAMFALQEINQISAPVRLDRGAAIFQLLEKESPGLDEFEAARDSVAAVLLQSKQNALWNKWYNDVVGRAESMNYIERQIADQRAVDDSAFF